MTAAGRQPGDTRDARDAGRTDGAGRGGVVALWSAVVSVCAVCCVGPLLAVLAAVGVTAGVVALAVPGLAVVAAVAFGGLWWLERRQHPRCADPGPSPADLGMPAAGPPMERLPAPCQRPNGVG